jgi:Protein of unknown function (DUF2794)
MEKITPISDAYKLRAEAKPIVVFDRRELMAIMAVYGRFVGAGLWRDYAIAMQPDAAIFSAFERASDRPDYQLIKRPELARKQGQYALFARSGAVLKRGAELSAVLAVLERKLVKLVD